IYIIISQLDYFITDGKTALRQITLYQIDCFFDEFTPRGYIVAVHPLLKYKHFDDMRLLHECVSGNYTAGDIVQKFRTTDVRQRHRPKITLPRCPPELSARQNLPRPGKGFFYEGFHSY